jgi:predicted DNA-binding ribbon-helix-helix protein
MRLEPEAWDALHDICRREHISTEELIARAVRAHPDGGRTSAVRVFILVYYRLAYRALAELPTNVMGPAQSTETSPPIAEANADISANRFKTNVSIAERG